MASEQFQTHQIGEAARKIKDNASEMKDAVVESGAKAFHQAAEKTEETIKANPFTSLLAAFGVGALIGIILFRK